MHLAIFCLLVILGAGLGHQLITAAIPAGTARQIMLVALAAAAGLLLFDRVVRADTPSSPTAERPA